MRILTAGESHGPMLSAIIEGIPAGLYINIDEINRILALRQQGYGRGKRMAIETDKVWFSSGVRQNITLGSPITMHIQNKDFKKWQTIMNPIGAKEGNQRIVTEPRPGHADLVGGQKRRFQDLRNVLERSSARETAMRVAIGALCQQLLTELGITSRSYVTQIGPVKANKEKCDNLNHSDLHCLDREAEEKMKQIIDEAKANGTSLGGQFTVEIQHVPAGIGDYTQWDKKIDGRLAQAMMSINAIKGVSFGDGEALAKQSGADMMDGIIWNEGFSRTSNHLGGVEGGMTNGEPIVVNAIMKPIPTQYAPLRTVNIHTKEPKLACVERSDTCAVPAASIIGEYVALTTLTMAILEQFDGTSMSRLKEQWKAYKEELERY